MQNAGYGQYDMTLAALTERHTWLLLADPRVLSCTAEMPRGKLVQQDLCLLLAASAFVPSLLAPVCAEPCLGSLAGSGKQCCQ